MERKVNFMGKKKNKSLLSLNSSRSFELVNLKSIDDEDKKKKEKDIEVTGPCTLKEMRDAADCFEHYLEIVTTFAIIKNIDPKKYKKAVKTVEKLIDNLRKGEGKEVYDEEQAERYFHRIKGEI